MWVVLGPDDAVLVVGLNVQLWERARLARLIRQPTSDVVPLDRVDSVNVGRLLAAAGTSNVVDAHVVMCARRAAQRLVTSDPGDLAMLDPTLELVVTRARRIAVSHPALERKSKSPR